MYTHNGYELLTLTKDLKLENLYATILKSALHHGDNIRLVVERNLQNACYESNLNNGNHVLAAYIKDNARKLFSSGHCWGFDHLLEQKQTGADDGEANQQS
jgi:hypothetical protein